MNAPYGSELMIYPHTDQLVFTLTDAKEKTILNNQLKLTNISLSNKLRFKIKCTSPFNFIVKPYELTLNPKQQATISIRAVFGDRDLTAFNFDKFELLWRIITPESSMFDMKQFWRGANRKIISVKIERPKSNYTPVMVSSLSDRQDEENIKDELNKLEMQCKGIESKIEFMKRRNEAESILNPRNFIVVGIISFVIGFAFA